MATLAVRNNNPGNLRDVSTGNFRSFGTPQEGFAALLNDLEAKQTGNTSTGLSGTSTLADFASKYAPVGDKNDPAQYTANLANYMGVAPNTQLKDLDLNKWAQAVTNAEDRGNAVSLGFTGSFATPAQVAQPEERSVGGFLKNVGKSGAGLLAGVGETILHPIQTVQNVGGAAVGGLEKIAGQETENTQRFDNLVNFFKDRYGSLDSLERTLYEDPVGFAADVSTVFGGAGLAAKGASLGSKAAKAGELSTALDRTAGVLNKAADVTNPLTPVAAGAGRLVNKGIDAAAGSVGKLAGLEPATIAAIRANPGEFTPQQIANVTREAVGNEVGDALRTRINSLNETSKAYSIFRDSPTEIPVAKNFLEDQLRNVAKLDVVDGTITPNGTSLIRDASEINKLQKTLDLWKPELQAGKLTPAKFLNLRQDLQRIAYNDLGRKNTSVARVTDEIRANLNKQYRKDINGLEELDLRFSSEQEALKKLRKGLIDKDGKLTDTAYSLVANAGNKGNAQRLARLEEIVPGITKKLEVLKAIEDVQRAMGTKVGTYGRSIAEYGGIVGGLATGQVGVVAAGLAAAIITKPSRAVQILRAAEKIDPAIVPQVLGRLARYATISSTVSEATQEVGQTDNTGTENQADSLLNDLSGSDSVQEVPQPISGQTPASEMKTLEELAKANNFDLTGARGAGYSDEEISAFLQSSPR